MTTDMTIRQNGLAPYIEPEIEEGDFGIADSELRAPFLSYNGKLGEFIDPITGEVSQSVRLVLLRRLPSSRIMWNKDLDATEAIQCRSLDTLYPVNAEQAAAIGAGPDCGSCRFAQFNQDASGKVTKSACSEYLNLAVAHPDDEEPLPYMLGVKSTGIKPVRRLLQQLAWLRVAKKAKHIPGYALIFQLERGAAAGEGAKKYFPLAGRVLSDLVPEDRWPGLSALWRVVSHATIDTTAEVVDDETEREHHRDDDQPFESAEDIIARMDAEERAAQEIPVEPQPSWATDAESLGGPGTMPFGNLGGPAPRIDPDYVRRGRTSPKP